MTKTNKQQQQRRAIVSAFLWLAALLAIMILAATGGCMEPAEKQTEPGPAPITDTDTETPAEPLSMKVEADASLIATLHEMLGDGGRLVIDPDRAIVVKRPAATLTIKPGTEVRYELAASRGTITFSKPRPKIEAKVWGLRISPELAKVELSPDNTGTAHVDTGPVTIKRRFSLAWEDAAGIDPATDNRPVVRMYSADACLHCDLAKTALAGAALPFRVEEYKTTGGEVPAWVEAFPTFHWDAGDEWRQSVGWPGLDAFVDVWKRSRK